MFHVRTRKTFMRGMAAGTAALALTTGAVIADPPRAAALNRVDCGDNHDFLWLYSNSTTCWANAGTESVVLYQVSKLDAGNNAGYIERDRGGRLYFAKGNSYSFPSTIVRVVHID